MKLLDKLDRKYNKYAIHNLMLFIVFANAAVFILSYMNPGLTSILSLNPTLIRQGQVWRLISFIMIPPGTYAIFIFFVLYFYYMIGQVLEREWGAFKFNVYYFLGMILIIIGSFITNTTGSVYYLNTTLFFAFATLYPNYQIRLYMILPIKVKYLAYFSAAIMLFMFITGGLGTKVSILAGLGNYLIFFGKDLVTRPTNRAKSAKRKQNYKNGLKSSSPHMHKCHVCGRTEKDDPTLEFRYCSKCDGYYEYCSDHLKDHEHVKEVQH